jgi:3-phosphoshikimate 1-carboxyvinyltransferase
MAIPLTALKSGPLTGRATVPGDKSISHRALIIGALAEGQTRITGLLEADDIMATARVLQRLGANIFREEGGWTVIGRGLGGFLPPSGVLDFGNSGTGARLMMGIIAGQDFAAEFTGDDSLCRRPMGRVLDPLMKMGLQVKEGRDTLPLILKGAASLVPIVYTLPVASAQVKSAILLAGLFAAGETAVIEPEPTRDHTEKMLAAFGASLEIKRERAGATGRRIVLKGRPRLVGRPIGVPADPSSAAFLVAAALICPGSDITLENILINPTRTGFYDTILEMGADIAFENERTVNGEPVADLRVRHGPLQGVQVPAERAPTMIDEYPCLAALSAFAEGRTEMEGLAELRVKESDRLEAMIRGLRACGVAASSRGDTLTVEGGRGVPGGAVIATEMDHRIAMAFLTLGLGADRPVTVDDTAMIATSFTGFRATMEHLGAAYREGPGESGAQASISTALRQ